MKATLSVSIIAKNEENNIEACIKSLIALADEIIVVDTGSTDNTVEKAEALGAKVYHHRWNNDFADAKNAALEKCTKDWILVIDCDEVLSKEGCFEIKKLLNNDKIEGYYLKLINYIGTIAINHTPSLRLFRNNPKYRFKSKLHEQIYDSITLEKGDKCLISTNIELYHYGYDHNIVDMSKKIQRNIQVLESFEAINKDSFYFYSLANEYSKLNQNEKALELYLKALENNTKDYGFYPYLSVNLIKLLITFKRPLEALEKTYYFENLLKGFRDIYFLKSMCEYELYQYNNSYNSLLKYTTHHEKNSIYPAFNFENDNNIEGMLSGLNVLRTPHENNLCSSLIIYNGESKENLDNIIKEISDISEEIFIYTTLEDYRSKITDNVYSIGDHNKDELLERVIPLCSSQWLIVNTSGMVFSKFHKKLIVNRFSTCKDLKINLFKSGDYCIKINGMD